MPAVSLPEYHSMAKPLLYLGGPSISSWRAAALGFAAGVDASLAVAVPTTEGNRGDQLRWRSEHLDYASRHGAIVFWFPAGIVDAHAQIEVGWVLGEARRNPMIRVLMGVSVLGTETQYERFLYDLVRPGIPIHRTLSGLVSAGARAARGAPQDITQPYPPT